MRQDTNHACGWEHLGSDSCVQVGEVEYSGGEIRSPRIKGRLPKAAYEDVLSYEVERSEGTMSSVNLQLLSVPAVASLTSNTIESLF